MPARALAPRQVITGGDYEPYGINTDLGLSIVDNPSQIPKSTAQLMVGDPEVKVTQVLQMKVVEEETFLERFERFSKWKTALNVVACIKKLAKAAKKYHC